MPGFGWKERRHPSSKRTSKKAKAKAKAKARARAMHRKGQPSTHQSGVTTNKRSPNESLVGGVNGGRKEAHPAHPAHPAENSAPRTRRTRSLLQFHRVRCLSDSFGHENHQYTVHEPLTPSELATSSAFRFSPERRVTEQQIASA